MTFRAADRRRCSLAAADPSSSEVRSARGARRRPPALRQHGTGAPRTGTEPASCRPMPRSRTCVRHARPKARAHVVDRRNARALKFALERQIEIGSIDPDEEPRPRRDEPPSELSPDRVDFPKNAAGPRRSRAPPAFPWRTRNRGPPPPSSGRLCDELQSGNLPTQRGDEVSSEKVPRSLSRDHAYHNGFAFHRG